MGSCTLGERQGAVTGARGSGRGQKVGDVATRGKKVRCGEDGGDFEPDVVRVVYQLGGLRGDGDLGGGGKWNF